jgi:hypothetical protein
MNTLNYYIKEVIVQNFYLYNTFLLPSDDKKINSKLKVGDWDFTIKCNYSKLNEILNNEEIGQLLNYI